MGSQAVDTVCFPNFLKILVWTERLQDNMLYEFQNLQRRRFGHAVDIYEDFYPSIRSQQNFSYQEIIFRSSRIVFPHVFLAILSLDFSVGFEIFILCFEWYYLWFWMIWKDFLFYFIYWRNTCEFALTQFRKLFKITDDQRIQVQCTMYCTRSQK